MKPAVAFSFFLSCSGFLLADSTTPQSHQPAPLLEELVRFARTGSSDATVLAYAQAHRKELPTRVSDEDLLWLRQSGVSESVVRYLTAIDIRISDVGAPEYVAYDSGEVAAYPRAEYWQPYTSNEGYPDNTYNDYADYSAYPASAYDGYYPYYGGVYYPYPIYFVVNGHRFFGRFHDGGHGHRFGGHHGSDGGHGFRGHHGGGGGGGHRGSSDAWRERGFAGRRGGPIAASPGRSVAPAFNRGNVAAGSRGPRGGVVAHGGPARPAISRGGMPHGPGGPRGGAVGPGGFGHAGFSGGHGGGGFGRGPMGTSGGGHAAAGPAGGHGRR